MAQKNKTQTPRYPRPAALALVEAMDRGLTRGDLADLSTAELSQVSSILQNWYELAASERIARLET